jgi:hypothetical protein
MDSSLNNHSMLLFAGVVLRPYDRNGPSRNVHTIKVRTAITVFDGIIPLIFRRCLSVISKVNAESHDVSGDKRHI